MIFKNIPLPELLDREHYTIFCFGCGNYFKAFLDEARWLGFKPNLAGIIDNYALEPTFSNQNITLGIISLEEFLKLKNQIKKPVLLLTTAYYEEIVSQLSQYHLLDDLEYYIYPLMQSLSRLETVVISGLEKSPVIPKKIHYCWFGGGEIPKKDQDYIDGWKKLCPDYEIIEWNEKNYDVLKSKYMAYAYREGRWACVSDYARFDILQTYGGFYFDTDVELLRDISPLRFHHGFMGMEAAGGVASGLGCGFVKSHPMLKELLEVYHEADFLDKDGHFMMRVNADYESELFRKYGFIKNNQFQLIREVAVYPPEFFSPLIVGSDILHITNNTYSIHHYHYSWRKSDF